MGKRALKRRMESLTKRLEEHELKIRQEMQKQHPDFGLIRYWEREIAAFQISIDTARKD
jgi:hypothetical protein